MLGAILGADVASAADVSSRLLAGAHPYTVKARQRGKGRRIEWEVVEVGNPTAAFTGSLLFYPGRRLPKLGST